MFRVALILLASFVVSQAEVDFNRDIQPILSENCYFCHGPDGKARKADLRLDRKEGAFRTKDDVTPVVPGDPGHSELIKRIFSDDPDEVMPSPKSHRTLTEVQKQALKRWVEEGAKWGEHWAFVAPKRAAVLAIAEINLPVSEWRNSTDGFSDWGRNPIDAFVAAEHENRHLQPRPEAPKAVLLRRLSLDLAGLSPTPEELRAFESDRSPNAYEKVVDRLLASPTMANVWRCPGSMPRAMRTATASSRMATPISMSGAIG